MHVSCLGFVMKKCIKRLTIVEMGRKQDGGSNRDNIAAPAYSNSNRILRWLTSKYRNVPHLLSFFLSSASL